MGETKFTKGPWSVYATGERWGIEAENSVFSIVIFGDEEDDLGVHGRDAVNMKANAHLIAAAPEMYEALRDADEALSMVTAFESDARYIMGNSNFELFAARRKAIKSSLAKARGEQ